MDEAAGCLGGIFFIVLLGWVPFFYSSTSLLYLRHESEVGGGYTVECRYINATGLEWPQRWFDYKSQRDAFYCPRWKKIGAAID